jgi:hypothetical protein
MSQNWETVWTFDTARFSVQLQLTQDCDQTYDGDDDNGETQENINSGVYTMFDSRVVVLWDDRMIGADYLGSNVYAEPKEFWTAHRESDPMSRNCSIMRKARGDNVCVCHYFPSMVSEAIKAARENLCNVPKLRCA